MATRGRPGHRGQRHLQPALRLPSHRRRGDLVPVPDPAGWPAGREPATVGTDPGQDLHQPDHQLGRSGDHCRQQRPRPALTTHHPGGPLRGIRCDPAADPVLRLPIPERLVVLLRPGRPDRVLPPAGEPDRPERIQRSDELHRVEPRPTAPSATSSTPSPCRSATRWSSSSNSAGYYTLPTQYNVAVSLEAAQINSDPTSKSYLLQNLSQVYVDPIPGPTPCLRMST